MNPAEEIVKFWLQENGYFVQSSIHVLKGQGREIDILAIHRKTRKMKHIEVSVGIKMSVFKGDAAAKAAEYSKKFMNSRIKDETRRRFGVTGPIKRELVVGDVSIKHKDVLKDFTKVCKKHHIDVVMFSVILNDVADKLKFENRLNPIIRTVQLCKKFLSYQETRV